MAQEELVVVEAAEVVHLWAPEEEEELVQEAMEDSVVEVAGLDSQGEFRLVWEAAGVVRV